MKLKLAIRLLAVLTVPLLGCSARLSIKTDVANPSAIGAVRVAATAHSVCRAVLTGEDEAVMQEARSALTHASATCAAKLRELAKSAATPQAKNLLRDSAAAVEDIKSEFEPGLEAVSSRREAARSTLGQTSEAPCLASERNALVFLQYDEQRKDALAELGDWAEYLASECGELEGVSEEVEVATEKTKAADSIIGSGSLTRSDYAFAVATLDDKNWKRFNVATADAHGGNLDVAIKMNEPGDFTIKGMRFDASKSAELVGKSLTQVLLLAAGHVGLAPTSTNGGSIAMAPQNAFASAQATEIKREAMVTAYRTSAVEIALLVAAEAHNMSSSPQDRKAAVTDRPKGATDDRRNGATFGWLERDSNGVSGCGVFGVFCNR
ncbi:MAG: hypothetical protein HYV17_15575 [Xanthomonadales bacterium]|nr:hypothetical protein [Xanthomonadales bacterium]